jgi:DNA-binding cell septation regulator SpoVG
MSNTKFEIRVYPMEEPKGSTKAFASVAIDEMVAIRGVREIGRAHV